MNAVLDVAAQAANPWSGMRNIVAFARREIRDAVSSRWFAMCTGAFALLAVGVSFMSLAGSGSSGFAGFGRTAAGLLNMIMLIVPLMALAAGAGSIAGERERGTLLYLLAQPVTRLELLLGKYVGLGIALTGSLCIGFGLSAGVLTAKAGGADAGTMLTLVGFTCLLAWVMLGVGMVISVVSRKVAVATGVGLFVWLAMVFVSDLGLMAGAIVFRLRVQELFILAMLNPLQAFKMGVIVQMNASLDVLGPAGMYASQTYAGALPWMHVGVLLGWGMLGITAAGVLFTRRTSI